MELSFLMEWEKSPRRDEKETKNFCCDQGGKPFLKLWWMDCIKSWKSEPHIILLGDVDFIYNFSEWF